MNKHNVIILAAGKGTRLGDITQTIPKCLVTITENKAILDLQLEALLADVRIGTISIVCGYKKECIFDHLHSKYKTKAIQTIFAPEYENSNTARSLAVGIRNTDAGGGIIQLNGDVVFGEGVISGLLDTIGDGNSKICVKVHPCQEEEMKVLLSPSGSVTSISKELAPALALGEAIGINYFSGSFTSKLVDGLDLSFQGNPQAYFEAGVNHTIKSGEEIGVFNINDAFAVEVDFPDDLLKARNFFAR